MIGKTNAVSGVSATPVPRIKTVSGSVISISDALAQSAESLVADINAVQSGSGDPSPSNIRPISGWSNVNVYREAQYDAGATPYATINLNGTVYGGSLDVTTGALTVDRAMITYNGTESMNPNGQTANTSRFYIAVSGKANGTTNLISDRFSAEITTDTIGRVSGRASSNGIEFFLPSSVPQTIQGAKDWFTENPTQVCYELATPQTVQLSPTTVQMLLGNNTIWADSGDSELQYWARR